MTVYKISNISLKDVRKYLTIKGAKKIRNQGGHEMWFHKNLSRSITLQSHIDPVYEFIVQQIINYFGDSKKQFHEIINNTIAKKPKPEIKKTTKRGKNSKEKNK